MINFKKLIKRIINEGTILGYIGGIVTVGGLNYLSIKQFIDKSHYGPMPVLVEIKREDINKDGLQDLLYKFGDGQQVIFIANKNEKGDIKYKLQR